MSMTIRKRSRRAECACRVLLILLACVAVPGARSWPAAARGSAAEGAPDKYDPVADPRAVVKSGHVRFTVLTPELLRMEWAEDGVFEDRPSFVFLNRHLPLPEFQQKKDGNGVLLKTAALNLTYAPARGAPERFSAENLSVSFLLNGKERVWRPGIDTSGNLMGTTRTLDGARGDQTKEPMGLGLISRDGWVLVDDSQRPLFDGDDFSFARGEQSRWPWVAQRPRGDRQDWYFFGYGHRYEQALKDFILVAGRIPLPPRFAFGMWWSRYWAYSDQELEELVREFHANTMPLDVLVIDMDWHKTFGTNWWNKENDASGHIKGWSGYSWSKLLFPNPGAFLRRMHEEGLRITLNVHPASGVQPWEDAYPSMARAMGIDPSSHQYVPFDITDKKFASNYLDLLHHPLERQGVDFWWLDWQQEANTRVPGVNPTWWLNYVHFTDQQREGKRPLLFHRWGGLGNHRYQIGFSGDTISVWESLAFQPWFTATAANVGYAYWSHDIGGHMPGSVDAELFTRWIQFGTFSPILRTHTTKNPDSERRVWAYPEPYSDLMRAAIRLRYALQPYVYTEARRTYDTGVAFLHPLYYEWPEAEEAYTSKGEYMFGENMLLAPVTKPVNPESQLADQTVWIPEGDWVEWATGRHFIGPATIKDSFSIRQIPVFLRAGAIIPLQPEMERTGKKPVDPLIVTVFPMRQAQTSSYTVYEDAGNTNAYSRGEAAWTEVTAMQQGRESQIEIKPVRGSYPGMARARGYVVRLPGDWPPEAVSVNGRQIEFAAESKVNGWRYDGNTLTTVITIARMPVSQGVRLRVRRAAALVARRAELNGFAGAMTRLREAYDTLNSTYPLAWSPDGLIEAMQSGDRLTYFPERAGREVAHFYEILPTAVREVRGMGAKVGSPEMQQTIEAVGKDWSAQLVQEKVAQYRQTVQRGLLQAEDAAGATKKASASERP
jgi:alpha-glucosidase (family GH31 glycosyl hydrolase)